MSGAGGANHQTRGGAGGANHQAHGGENHRAQGEKPAVARDDVVAMIASLGDRETGEIGDRVDSMQLAWLVHQVEQRYGVAVELNDGQFARMSTVDGAVEVLREAIGTVPHD